MSAEVDQIVAQVLKSLYPQNPDVVLGGEARVIVATLRAQGYEFVRTDTGAVKERSG